jgi:hypothetical protein
MKAVKGRFVQEKQKVISEQTNPNTAKLEFLCGHARRRVTAERPVKSNKPKEPNTRMKIVKNKYATRMKPWRALLGAAPLLAAGTVCFAEEEKPFVTGTLALTVDTHFVSYGADVWAAGKDWDKPLFHPSIELGFDLGGGFKGILGTWWDVNNNATSSIGNSVQEVDVWAGLGYSTENWSFTVLYQEWMYANQSERIVDVKAGYSHFLNPSLTLHFRTDSENAGQDDGLVAVLGVAPSKTFEDLGNLTVSVPVNVAFNTDGYHNGDSGLTFISVGANASIPLTFMRGNWSFNAGITFFHTDEEVIPGNVEESFLTGTAGLTLSF